LTYFIHAAMIDRERSQWRDQVIGLRGKVALVTGAAGGIGRAICARFIQEGIRVIAVDIDVDSLCRLTDEIGAGNDRLQPLLLDITDHEAVALAVAGIIDEFGRIDILVNNAGWDIAAPFVETTPELWDKVISINLKGPLNVHSSVLPHMIGAGQGKVVNIASDAGRVGSTGESVYSACKGSVIALTKSLARECARNNITLNVVCPGPTDTPLLRSFVGSGEYAGKLHDALKRAIPMHRLGQPDDVPGMIAFLASDDAAFITGQVISVSGGLTMQG
jgi:2-hydroxycyclohexanecarboxyl-CoA dehydrogenase